MLHNQLLATETKATRRGSPFVGRVIVLLLSLAMVTFAIWPKSRLAALWAIGRNNGCSFEASVNSHHQLMQFTKYMAEFGAMSRVIESDGGFELLDTPRGRYWHSRQVTWDLLAAQEMEVYGDPGHGGVRPGDIVLDCGANIGTFVRTALFRGAKLVVAIELAPVTVEALRRAFEREIAEGRVIVYPKGVWDKVDTLDLEVSEGTLSDNSLVRHDPHRPNKVKVPVTTIDLIVEELHLPRVDFIKMDIEGAEKPALHGSTQTIRKFRPRMAIGTEHLSDDSVAIPHTVKAIWPDYSFEAPAGSCKDHFSYIDSDVLLFQATKTQ